MACPGVILGRRLVLEGKGSGSNHLMSIGADAVFSRMKLAMRENDRRTISV